MPSVRSRNTVSRNVESSTIASPHEDLSNTPTASFSIMFHETTARMPASEAKGIKLANGAATSINKRINSACKMPEIGLRAPVLTLVAVRAIVPVTQKPPNMLDIMFAAPCATSSQLDLCLRPVIPSATTADSRDSIAPSIANDRALGRTSSIFSMEKKPNEGAGRVLGIPPKRVPIVSTGK